MNEFNKIIDEIATLRNDISKDQIKEMISAIKKSNHIFLSGAGRSGLMIRSFANRLLHLGYSVSIVGEISSPHTKPNDLLILGSGSGETAGLIHQVHVAKKNNVKVGIFTATPKSTLGEMADYVVEIPTQTKLSVGDSLQPMGSLFEQTSLLVYDAIVLKLMTLMGETSSAMKQRHADLE
ncbi:6-phospho-3-hexuloisomerase [Dolosicoccus paucivorans]|uniref:6-phospho-3-hexuloisomerase n=1 Tax=Dolosicoccus paucivorans TaxID=84521 RepID=A0A2N6SPK7_9LACT|nr:6-phospho-3-hexuloisomerase [Dolosicoccus paucivorans]PMC58976.1 6-phospho-3-hexuloisomerase [Dolosicoccus paucivorans]